MFAFVPSSEYVGLLLYYATAMLLMKDPTCELLVVNEAAFPSIASRLSL